MNIIDAVIIILLICGFLVGLRRGAVKQTVTLIGIVLVIMGAYYLKNPIASFCYNTFPFINFKLFSSLSIINILFYELISFIIAASVLALVLRIVLKISGIIESVFKATIVLGFVSKIIGGVLGIIEAYIITFIMLFFFNQPFINISGVSDSKMGTFMLNNTPVLTNAVKGSIEVINDISKVKDSYGSKAFERDSIEKFLKYKVIDVKSLKVLKEKDKINFNELDILIKKYEGEN